eukprot:3985626-Ditylum_brightwellii.AAC.1
MLLMNDAVETSSVDSGLRNIDYDSMNETVEEVISNFRIFAKSMKKKKNTKDKSYIANLHNLLNKAMCPEIYKIGDNFLCKRQGKRKLGMLHVLCSIIQWPVMLMMKQRTDVF